MASLSSVRDLRAAERASVAEGRGVDARPQPPAVRHDDEQPPVRRQHPPQLAEQRPRPLAPLDHMHEEDAVGAFVGERQVGLVDEHAQAFALARPGDDAELGWHQRAARAGIVAEGAEIGRGEAHAEQALALQIAPARPDPRAQEPAHHGTEGRGIEVLEVDGVEMHRGRRFSVSSAGRIHSRDAQ